MFSEILLVLSSGVLGIFLGAQITEAVLFVPHWKRDNWETGRSHSLFDRLLSAKLLFAFLKYKK